MKLRLNILVFGLVGSAALLFGAAAPAPVPSAPAPAAKAPGDRVLSVGDRVLIAVQGEPQLNTNAPIVSAGTVKMAMVGDIKVAGLTLREAEQAVAKAFVEQEFIRRPQVVITIEQFAARYIYVSGEFNRKEPILYPSDSDKPFTLLDAIQRAQSFTDMARRSAVTVGRTGPDGVVRNLGPFDMEAVMEGRRTADNIVLQPGDTIHVGMRVF